MQLTYKQSVRLQINVKNFSYPDSCQLVIVIGIQQGIDK